MSQPRSVRFPSDAFPAFPELELSLPDGWEPVSIPGSVLAVARPLVEGEYRANVAATIVRVPGQVQLDDIAKQIHNRYGVAPQGEIIGDFDIEVSGMRAFHRDVTFADPDAGTVAQAVTAVCVEHGAWTDIVEVTGTCSGSQVEALFVTMRAITTSIKIANGGL